MNATRITTGRNGKKSGRRLRCQRCERAGAERGAESNEWGAACRVPSKLREARRRSCRRGLFFVDERHHVFGIALARSCAVRSGLLDAAQIVRRELHAERAEVFFQIFAAFSAGDGNDVIALGEKPCKSELAGSAILFFGDGFDAGDQVEILLKIVVLETRRKATVVVWCKILEALDLAGEKTAAERAVGYKSDSQLARRGREFRPRDRASTTNIRFAERRWGELCERGESSPGKLRRGRYSGFCLARTRSARAPTVSSMGVLGSTRCW